MTDKFGDFVHSSPLSSLPHDPAVTLASNCIRDAFGPTVQTVADCIQLRGGGSCTLAQLISTTRTCCQRVWNEERERLVKAHYVNLYGKAKGKISMQHYRARGPPSAGYVMDGASIRAALVVLLQHDLVKVVRPEIPVSSGAGAQPTISYELRLDRARLLSRHPRFIEFTKKALDEPAAALVEELLLNGRMRTVDAVVATVNQLQESGEAKSARHTQRQAVVESFRRLVVGGFLEEVPPLETAPPNDDGMDQEYEYQIGGGGSGGTGGSPKKKVKFTQEQLQQHQDHAVRLIEMKDDPAVLQLLSNAPYKSVLPRNAVWRVNAKMFHDSIRAFCLGRLVAERFGHRVQSAGSIVTAALKLAAHKQHAIRMADWRTFSASEIIPFLPKPVQQLMEKKNPGSNIQSTLTQSLLDLTAMTYPMVCEQVEDASHFHIAIRSLVEHLQQCTIQQMLFDSHGDVAARVCSILRVQGYLESDAIAESAMVPAKDTREVLHQLYRHNYVSLFTLNQSKQHNPSTMIYLWHVSPPQLLGVARDNVHTALVNIRLRRQHEVEVGKEWIERAKEAGETDENEHELDKLNYKKFCQGLERLDNAQLQLDETLMVLCDF